MLITIVIISSLTNYFMNSYHVIIDDSMVRNILQTNMLEIMDLLTYKQVLYLLILGVFPSFIIYKTNIKYTTFKVELFSKLKVILSSLLIVILIILIFSKHYASFFREHKPLRYTVNPSFWIYSVAKYIDKTFNNEPIIVKPIGEDAKIVYKKNNMPKLIIMVVGEAVRADHFSLNGYLKETNPLISKENIVNFEQMYSCGTSTAVSIPCMFSIYTKSEFNYKRGLDTQNVLDVLNHTQKISILWRDNNSNSKGVALRVKYEDYRKPKTNTICTDEECRDIGMLIGLDEYIKEQKNNDILIILHQMGNHGPAYYSRYDKEFEKFKPVCKTNQLKECTKEEISNAYDNAILYTDNFLSKTINFLKKYNNTHKSALVYMSDHGESLGENRIYLHGLPYFMAPESQIHVASFMWFNNKFKEDSKIKNLINKRHNKYSQDNLFHTLLGLFEVETNVYKKEMDIINAN
jgi:lipid A ethanolaminephosphotransferase